MISAKYLLDKNLTFVIQLYTLEADIMTSKPLCIRIQNDLIDKLDKFAEKNERSRNYVIGKFLKEKIYELTAGDESC